MKNMITIIKCAIFLVAGLAIILLPYEKIKVIFPNAPSPVVVKAMGIVVILCGIVIVFLFSGL